MTLLDAPQFDAARAKRNTLIIECCAGALVLLFVAWWLAASRPVDWPWNWNRYLFGRATVNKFLSAVEANDLPKAAFIPSAGSRATGARPVRTTNTGPFAATGLRSPAAMVTGCWWPCSSTAARAARSTSTTIRKPANSALRRRA